MNVILFGVQGSGKGTQAKILSEKTGLKHVTTGDLFRENIENKTELGKKVLEFIEKGDLVPDKYVLEIVQDALDNLSTGFILDGFPRNPSQGEFLLKKYNIDKVVLLELTDDVSVKRLMARRLCKDCKTDYNMLYKLPKKEGICDLCGGEVIQRKDDNETAIKLRLDKFHNETEQVIKVFADKGIVCRVNADQEIGAIQKEILENLGV
ncbi:MAG: nucleoside monophosphate kinase [Candidatus Cloacimonetes bacterium]|nr:nucleoside monophosphate kinase [Candidatus Cloacimonadota bacterium]